MDSYLDSRLAQRSLRRQSFARRHAGVVGPLELLLKFLELFGAEGGPVSSELWLFRTVETTVVVVAI